MKLVSSFFSTHRKFFGVLICVVLLVTVDTHVAYAVDPEGRAAGAVAAATPPVTLGYIEGFVLDLVSGITYAIGGMVAGIGGVILDLTVSTTVIQMGNIIGSGTEIGKGIISLWKVLRDIINIFFIFGLIYIGIQTILDSHKSETRRTLSMLIVAAFIINFSLYITEVVIDFSNILAIQIYNQITNIHSPVFSTNSIQFGTQSIAGAFLNVASVGSLFNGGAASTHLDFFSSIFYAFFMMIFLIICGAVFFMGALLLIKRFIALILYLIFSPAMFIGWVLPAFGSRQEQWRTGFVQQAFVAPVFLFMIYLSLVVLTKLQEGFFKPTGAGFGGITQGGATEPGTFTVILFFSLAIGFVYTSVKIAEKMSSAGASGSLKLFDGARGKIMGMAQNTVGGVTAGMAARAGRATVGRMANAAAESDSLKNSASLGGLRGWASKQALKGTRVIGDSNMDVRSAGVGGGAIGKGRKGGYKTVTSEIKKSEEEFAKSLGEIDDDDSVVKQLKDREHHLVDGLESLDQAKKDSLKEHQAAKKALATATARGDQAEIVKAEAELDIKKKALEHDQHAIADHKELIKKAKEDIATEKNRRVVGSAAANAQYKKTSDSLKKAREERVKLEKEFADAVDSKDELTEKAVIEKISKANQNIVELQKQEQTQAATLGYAATLETSNRFQSWMVGRNNVQDRAAGKAIRKTYTKKSLKDEAKGHDAHGGDHGKKSDGHEEKRDDHKDDAHGADHGHDTHAPAH